jgi:hypothetical protein
MNSSVHDTIDGSDAITPAHLRRTSRFLTKYEIAAAVALRARDITSGHFSYGRVLADNRPVDAETKRKIAGAGSKKRRVDDSDESSSSSSSSSGDDDDADDASGRKKNKKKQEASAAFVDSSPMAVFADQQRVQSMPMVFSDPVMIAKHELVQKRLPFVVKRCLGADLPSVNPVLGNPGKYTVEVIPINELEVDVRSIDLGEWTY